MLSVNIRRLVLVFVVARLVLVFVAAGSVFIVARLVLSPPRCTFSAPSSSLQVQWLPRPHRSVGSLGGLETWRKHRD